MKTFTLTVEYQGEAESWEEIRNNAENNKIQRVFIGAKEFVNVVRCKDCINGDTNEMGFKLNNAIRCNIHDDGYETHELDWFCKDGKRKENRNEE